MSEILKQQSGLRKPKHFMTDHNEQIVSVDSSYELDIYATSSCSSCVLRIMSTNRYFLTIKPQLDFVVKYKIYKIMLSLRGYLVIQARTAFTTLEKDLLIVYSINGELVAQKEVDETLNAILFDNSQYFIVFFSNHWPLDHWRDWKKAEKILHHHFRRRRSA